MNRKIRNAYALLSVLVVAVLAMSGSAFAAAPTDGASLVSSTSDNLTSVLIPAVAGVIGIGVLFWLAVKYFKRGTKQV